MAVKTRYQDALAKIGLTCVEYRVELEMDGSDFGTETWTNCLATGIALQRNGQDWRVIEHVPIGWGGDGKWRVYSARSRGEIIMNREQLNDEVWDEWETSKLVNAEPLGVAKLQRQALAIAIGL